MSATVIDQQCLLDIAIQEYGSVEAAFGLVIGNDRSITSPLQVGERIKLPEGNVKEKDIAAYYAAYHHHPATAILPEDEIIEPEGISYWGINVDFVVSTGSI